ncbi:hypothetical protein PJIAN_1664 [Paludibacter jiangxiensis]|uniref:Uncharacterized protein n=1 Tax=Paludibacter jiangxiensis TaxID=681398 RepID=A0A170YUJ5_9BACT|nr:hypothetical protein PJIAN_1664 [Paludibacter jiangxiensis]
MLNFSIMIKKAEKKSNYRNNLWIIFWLLIKFLYLCAPIL